MANHPTLVDRIGAMDAIHYLLRSVPLTCFGLALVTDIFYWQTSNLLWLHFSEWLLLVAVAFAGLAILAVLVDMLIRRVRPSWPAMLFGLVVFILGLINNFVHTADGWTAVVPFGLALSAATVLAMIVTAWFGAEGARHV
jgi:uncharacterized membrane protein